MEIKDIKKGQKVWVDWRNDIIETAINSVGRKYITVEYDSRVKFDRETLLQVGGAGVPYNIILDIDEHNKKLHYYKLADALKRVNWAKIDRDKLDAISKMLDINIGNEEG